MKCIATFLLVVAAGCTHGTTSDRHSSYANQISPGMTADDVKEILGEPLRNKAMEGPGRLVHDKDTPVFDSSGNVIDHLTRYLPGDPVLHFSVGRSNLKVTLDEDMLVKRVDEYWPATVRNVDGATLQEIEKGSLQFVELSNTPALSDYSLASAWEVSGASIECWISVESGGKGIETSERMRVDAVRFSDNKLSIGNAKAQVLFAWHKSQNLPRMENGLDYRKNCRLALAVQHGDSLVQLDQTDVDVRFGVIPNLLSGASGRIQSLGVTHGLESHATSLPKTPTDPFELLSESLQGKVVDSTNSDRFTAQGRNSRHVSDTPS